jgi:hypothetical protein
MTDDRKASHMDDIYRLIAIEDIRRTKATYWWAMDTKNWNLLGSTFTRDAIADFRGERDLKPGMGYDLLEPVEKAIASGDPLAIQGRDNIVSFLSGLLGPMTTVHLGAAPIIEVLSLDNANAIWPLFDFVDDGKGGLKGYGHYHDTYRLEDRAWRVESLRLTRLRTDGASVAEILP